MGAFLSMSDYYSDLYITYQFYHENRMKWFKLNVVMLMSSILIGMFVVWVQNHKRGVKTVLIQWIPVATGFKPAVSAFKIASGAPMKEGK